MKSVSYLAFVIMAIAAIMIASCEKYGIDKDPGSDIGKMKIGNLIEVATSTIGVNGGTIKISKSGTPVDGLEMNIPANSFSSDITFKVSFAEIKSHELGPNFNPVSPLVNIICEGGYANEILSLTIPVTIPAGHIPLGFYFDETTGKLEGIPFKEIGKGSITLLTRHFLSADKLKSRARPLKSSTLMGLGANIIISSISESVLNGQPIISSGFKPGVDDWEFVNYGSYLAPGGHCAGQNMAAMWYYFEKKTSEGNLFNKFSDNANMWEDNARGYRFCSVIQEDIQWDGMILSYFWNHIDRNQELDPLKLSMIAGAMLTTGEPQAILIYREETDSTGKTKQYGHALICYQVSVRDGKMFISDPNTPGTGQVIEFKADKFQPYIAKLNGNDAAKPYPFITYTAKTALIDWNKIGQRYGELLSNTIGTVAPNVFPAYTIYGLDDTGGFELKDGQVVIKDTLRTVVICPTAEVFEEVDNQKRIGLVVFDQNGGVASQDEENQKVRVILKPGLNKLGYYILGWRKNFVEEKYVDFKWLTVTYFPLSIDPDPLSGKPGTEYKWTATTKGMAPSNSFYVWDFGDETAKLTIQNDSIATHTYVKEGEYVINIELLDSSLKNIGKASAKAHIKEGAGNEGAFEYYGRTYKYRTYGTQTWMIENLAYLPEVGALPQVLLSATEPRYYVYGYDGMIVSEAKAHPNFSTYGVLYNLLAASTACPPGWHLPSLDEWKLFVAWLDANGYGSAYYYDYQAIGKSISSTTGWKESSSRLAIGNDQSLNNSSGFNARPGGQFSASYYYLGESAYFWTTTRTPPGDEWNAFCTGLYYYNYALSNGPSLTSVGFSVRCIKN